MQTSFVFVCLLSLLLGQDGASLSPEKAAIDAYQKGHLTQASVMLEMLRDRPRRKRESWAKWNAKRMRVAYLAARIALKRKRPEEAVSWLEPLIDQPSSFRDYIAFTLANALVQSDQPNKAIKLYRLILREFGGHWRRPVRRKLIQALRAAKDWDGLGAHLKRLLWYPRPYGGRRKVLWQMVNAYIKAGQPKKVKKWLRHIPLRYPTSQEAKRAQQAVQRLTASNKIKMQPPRDDEALWRTFNLAWVRPKQALAHARQALQDKKIKDNRLLTGQWKLVIARAYLRLQEYSAIIPLVQKLVERPYPTNMRSRAIYLLGRAYIETSQYKAGWKALHRYTEREPTRKRARWAAKWAARLAMLDQNYKRARRFYWEYLQVYPDISAKQRREAKWFRAWCLFRMGEYRKTINAFRKLYYATRKPSFRRRIRYWRGRAYERWGKWRKAKSEYAHLVTHTALTFYGLLAKQRLQLLELQIKKMAQPLTCLRKAQFVKVAATPKRRRRRKAKPTPKLVKVPRRVALKNPLWTQRLTQSWQKSWAVMMELQGTIPSTRAHRDQTMRSNVKASIKHAQQPVPFPKIPVYCNTHNTRSCRYLKRARIFASLGLTQDAVAELFRGRWMMKRPQKRLAATIRWFRSVSAHHEAIRMTYWLGNWGNAFKENEYMQLRYPPAHASLLFAHTQDSQVPLAFAWGIMREESLFFRKTYSRAAARGLMQIIPSTAYKIARRLKLKEFTLQDLYEPHTNVKMGCWYLGQLLEKFESNVQLAAAAYNAGPHRVVAWLRNRRNLAADEFTEEIPFDETREYVRRVLRSYTIYNYLYKRLLPRPLTTVAVRVKDNINF